MTTETKKPFTTTEEYIDSLLVDSEMKYLHLYDTLTVVVLKLRSGFCLVGKSACISPELFDKDLGLKIAYNDARDQLWELEGYRLKNLGNL